MKLSSETLEVLQAITRINSKAPVNGASLKQGSRIKARRYKSDMPVLYATIPDEFPQDWAVFDLPKFLSMFSVLEDPELTFEDKYIEFKSGKKKAKIRYVAPHLIEHDANFYTREIKMPSVDFQCEIDKSTLKAITDATAMFQAPQIAFTGDGSKVLLTTYNLKDPKADKMEIEVGESSWKFNIIVDMGLIQFIRRDYTVSLSNKGLLQWHSDNIDYFLTASDKSTF